VIEVVYAREVPYPRPIVLSQYFDLEHLEHVHPRSFGRARVVGLRGRVVVWDLEWPAVLGGLRLRSRFEQEYLPPWSVHARVVGGTLRGAKTLVQLLDGGAGTRVVEVHRLPLPDLPGLRRLVERAWTRRLDRIWDEDLAVRMCRGGWPGVPAANRTTAAPAAAQLT
jgi:hypothetical protein